jgi:hypothetical protein
MADKHADTPDATTTANTETRETGEHDVSADGLGTPAGPGLANRLPAAEHSVMHGQLRRRSAPDYRTERRVLARADDESSYSP